MTKTRQIYNSKNKKYKKTKKNIKRGGVNDKSKYIPRKQKSEDDEILSTSAEHLINIITTNLNVIGQQCKDVLLDLGDYIFHIAHNSKWPDNQYTDFKEWCVYNKTQLDRYKGMKNELSKLQNDFPALNSVIVILQKKIEDFEEIYNHFKDVKCMSKERGRAQTPLPPTPKNKGRRRTTRSNVPPPPPRISTTRRTSNNTYNHLEHDAIPVLNIDPDYAEYNNNMAEPPYNVVDPPSAIAPYHVITNVNDIINRKTQGNVVKPEPHYDVVDPPSTNSSTTPAGEIRSRKPPTVHRYNKPTGLNNTYNEPEISLNPKGGLYGVPIQLPPRTRKKSRIRTKSRTRTKSDCDKTKGYSWCPTNIPSKRCYNTANGICLAAVKRLPYKNN